MRKLILALIVLGVLYYAFSQSDTPSPAPAAASTSTFEDRIPTPPAPHSGGSFGSGHEAGYRWAEDHNISDESDCEAAGDHSNSPSFAEGCTAYVDQEGEK